jgi:hypothetical protein
MLNRQRPVVERPELEIVIVPGEAQPGRRKARRDCGQPRSERLPPVNCRRTIGGRQIGRDDELDPEASPNCDRPFAFVFQHREAEVPASCAEP